MEQMTAGKLRTWLAKYPDDTVIYLGDDEELNGVHQAYFVQKETGSVINELSYGNYKKSGILIS